MRAGFQLLEILWNVTVIFVEILWNVTVIFVYFVKSWVIETEQGCLLLWRQEVEPLEDFSNLKILLSTFTKHTFSPSLRLENKQPFPHPLSRVAARPAG